MFCINCGAELSNAAAFCSRCGHAVSGAPPSPPQAATPTEPSDAGSAAAKTALEETIEAIADRPVSESLPKLFGMTVLIAVALGIVIVLVDSIMGPATTTDGFGIPHTRPMPLIIAYVGFLMASGAVKNMMIKDPLELIRWNRFKNGLLLGGTLGFIAALVADSNSGAETAAMIVAGCIVAACLNVMIRDEKDRERAVEGLRKPKPDSSARKSGAT